MAEIQTEKSERAQKAMAYFLEGYNCSQAVVLAFEDLYDIDRSVMLKLSSSFGGGMGRLREVCGSISGMFMVAGLLYGYNQPKAAEAKAKHYAVIQELAEQFREQNGSIVCRELLGLKTKGADAPTPEARTAEYYKKRPCKELVGMSAAIMENYINTHPYQ
ncbi:MAG: C-GCAxxG-C-C family protein [Hespellia sp.]|nr:C-GCAxxG-C-C family protein [Hespellia sp.]